MHFSDLLVDGEVFDSACAVWDGCVHSIIAKYVQRAINVESLIDDLTWQTGTGADRDTIEEFNLSEQKQSQNIMNPSSCPCANNRILILSKSQ